jgi:hypothetical protein
MEIIEDEPSAAPEVFDQVMGPEDAGMPAEEIAAETPEGAGVPALDLAPPPVEIPLETAAGPETPDQPAPAQTATPDAPPALDQAATDGNAAG